jgi:hypothetical protein
MIIKSGFRFLSFISKYILFCCHASQLLGGLGSRINVAELDAQGELFFSIFLNS